MVGFKYDRSVMVETLVYHQRRDIEGCACGWSVLGASHAEHVADVYELSVSFPRANPQASEVEP